ncbi:MAG TPA: vitamin K epoxide reductase family protein [Gemmatimonadota bacterium]|nr:vitamin K epoxide reductase family protein [Gemmatimonadota bacterium]
MLVEHAWATFAATMPAGIWIARVLALVGFADAAYLTATHYAGSSVFCGASGGCETVLSSEFATLGPVPIALIGAVYYGLASLLAWTPGASWSRTTAGILAGLTGLAFAISAVLFGIQAFQLHAWCRFCLVSAAITMFLFATSIWLLRRA